ncbi:YcxB family protein [Flavobacterium sp. RHBU_24]|uniref:YcxB family protein n=1 Tax=Flavobacterium sp. RHBU_24 TaxID=3391185 RepID=UPI0039848B25
MEKEVITTQNLDANILKKGKKAILLSLSPKLWLYIVIIILLVSVNLFTSQDEIISDSNPNTNTNRNDAGIWLELLNALAPIIALIVIFIVMLRFMRARNSKKMIENKARYFTNITYTINQAFFKKQGEGFENTYNWKEIYRIQETLEFYLVFSEKTQAHIIDKAQLDPWQLEEIKEIFELIKSKVKVSLK